MSDNKPWSEIRDVVLRDMVQQSCDLLRDKNVGEKVSFEYDGLAYTVRVREAIDAKDGRLVDYEVLVKVVSDE